MGFDMSFKSQFSVKHFKISIPNSILYLKFRFQTLGTVTFSPTFKLVFCFRCFNSSSGILLCLEECFEQLRNLEKEEKEVWYDKMCLVCILYMYVTLYRSKHLCSTPQVSISHMFLLHLKFLLTTEYRLAQKLEIVESNF